MNVASAIETRRSIKAYDPGHCMSEAEIERLLSLALLSPSAFNIQNWRFVLVRDAALRGELQCDRELVLRDGVWQVVEL